MIFSLYRVAAWCFFAALFACLCAGGCAGTFGGGGGGEGEEGGSGVVLYVDAAVSVSGDGRSWETAFKGLDEALAAASAGDEVWVAEGTYVPSTGTGRDVSFRLGAGVRVYGGFRGGETDRGMRVPALHPCVLSGDLAGDDDTGGGAGENAYHVVVMEAGSVLDGFTVRGGNADGPVRDDPDPAVALADRMGGGVVCAPREGGSVTVRNCTFAGNRAHLGGAAAFVRADVTVEMCAFTGNTAAPGGETSPPASGGAVYVSAENARVFSLADSSFTGNTAGSQGAGGGAVSVSGPVSCVVARCTFSGNGAAGLLSAGGAGRFEGCSSLRVEESVFTSNDAGGYGGALHVFRVSCTVTASTFSSNRASSAGGAVRIEGGELDAARCTFEGNVVSADAGPRRGGAVSLDGSSAAASFTASNCVFYGNRADGGASTDVSRGGAVAARESCTVEILFSTFSANAAEEGGAVSLESAAAPCALTVNSSILWGDTAAAGTEVFPDPGGTAAVDYTDIGGGWPSGTGNLSADPLFRAGGDLHISAGPCVNTGDPARNPGVDRDGTARDGQPDMGAYEYVE